MAGMRPFVLYVKIASAYYDSLAAAGCPSSQIAIVKLSAVPLWKVIVGPAPTNCKPDPQGSGFLSAPRFGGVYAPLRVLCQVLARRPVPIYLVPIRKR